MKRQSRTMSAVESTTNVLVGYGVAVASQIILFPFFDIHVTLQDNLYIGLWFTAISLARSYAIRRLFNSVSV